jgi:hypothetical protein
MNARAQLWFLNRWLGHLPCLHIQKDGQTSFLFTIPNPKMRAQCLLCMESLTSEEAEELYRLLVAVE